MMQSGRMLSGVTGIAHLPPLPPAHASFLLFLPVPRPTRVPKRKESAVSSPFILRSLLIISLNHAPRVPIRRWPVACVGLAGPSSTLRSTAPRAWSNRHRCRPPRVSPVHRSPSCRCVVVPRMYVQRTCLICARTNCLGFSDWAMWCLAHLCATLSFDRTWLGPFAVQRSAARVHSVCRLLTLTSLSPLIWVWKQRQPSTEQQLGQPQFAPVGVPAQPRTGPQVSYFAKPANAIMRPLLSQRLVYRTLGTRFCICPSVPYRRPEKRGKG